MSVKNVNKEYEIKFHSKTVDVIVVNEGKEKVNTYNLHSINSTDEIKTAIEDTVKSCLVNDEVNYYFIPNNILKGIIKYFTDIPVDMFNDYDIECTITNGKVEFDSEPYYIFRFKEAVNNKLELINEMNKRSNSFDKIIKQLSVPFENDEIGYAIKDLFLSSVINMVRENENNRSD